MRQLCKGNVAIVKGAILAGCRSYFGYPITPASEIAEAAALLLPQVDGTFLQAESEVAAINMVYGAAAAGARVMTASSGPGLSLMQEGISYCAGAELPCVIVDIVRGGPGLGNIAPEQSDYFAMVKGGGHGCYRNFVLAPASVQEMADLTILAFELADEYRNPAIILADGFIGQMMEPLDLTYREAELPDKPWAVMGTAGTRKNLVSSIFLEPDDLENHIRKLEAKYIRASRIEARHETFEAEDAEVLLVGYGITARVLRSTVEMARRDGLKAGLVPSDYAVAVPQGSFARRRQQSKQNPGGRTEQWPDARRCPPHHRRQSPSRVLRQNRRQRSVRGRSAFATDAARNAADVAGLCWAGALARQRSQAPQR